MTIVEGTRAEPAEAPVADPSCGPWGRLEASLGLKPTDMSIVELRQQMRLVRSVHAIAAARLIELHDAMVERSVTGAQGSPQRGCAVDPIRELRTHGGLRARDVRSLDTQTRAVAAAPLLGDLLSAGATTAGHVEAVGQALTVAGDGCDDLLDRVQHIAERAVTMSVDDFTRHVMQMARDAQPDDGLSLFQQQRRSTHHKMWTDREGMLRYSGAFDPERGAAFAGRIDAAVEAMFHSGDRDTVIDVAPGVDANDHRRALALHQLVTRGGSAGGAVPDQPVDTRPARAEIIVHVDHDTLVKGLHEGSICRTSQGAELPPETVRRLACDADIIPVVLTGDGVPIDVGRAKRLATVHQRRAIEAVHESCAIEGCQVAFSRCTVHHLRPWEDGGRTDLDNLVPLCSRHHHAAHEGGWRLRLEPGSRRVAVSLPGEVPDG